MKGFLTYRQTAAALFLIPAALLSFGYYLQFVEGIEPCPLCMTQRLCFYFVAMFALLSLIGSQSLLWRRISNALIMLGTITGLSTAARQLWLQNLPADQVPACGPSFEFIIQTFPLSEAIGIMFKGTGDCAEVSWTFLGLSIAAWSFIFFSGLLLVAAAQLFRPLADRNL